MTAEGWMALRWLDVMSEMPELRKVARRGKVLARKKAVDKLEVSQGLVTAEIEDDGGAVFSVRVRQAPLEPEVWDEVLDELAADASHAASLLAGRITQECAEVFDLAGIDLFPFDVRDMTTFCTCAADGLLCRHAAATHHALAVAIELDPFLLFVFRGIDRGELMQKLREKRGVPHTGAEGLGTDDMPVGRHELEAASSLADGYWERGVLPHLAFRLEADDDDDGEGDGEGHKVALPVCRALGEGPGGLRPDDIVSVLTPIVKMARRRVADIVVQASTADAAAAELSTASESDNLDEILVAAAHQHGELTTAFVAKAMGISKPQARKYLQWLVEEGRLTVEGKARATRYLPVVEG